MIHVALTIVQTTDGVRWALLAARISGIGLGRTQPRSTSSIDRPIPRLYRLSVGRRPWAIANGAVIVALIVALATCLAAFTASYDGAKMRDARYANGADIRLTPSPSPR